jgi:hypothetical protein
MFCPRCAAQNLDDAKFCRGCGTNIEIVALALSDSEHPTAPGHVNAIDSKLAKSSLKKRREARNKLIQAGGLIGGSTLVGAALGIFSNQPDWIFVWLVFAGWMACWGIMSLVSGIGELMDAKDLARELDTGAMHTLPPKSFTARASRIETSELTPPGLIPPPSITENTTEHLIKKQKPSKPE